MFLQKKLKILDGTEIVPSRYRNSTVKENIFRGVLQCGCELARSEDAKNKGIF
jgi:hypothetical protein